MTPSFPPRPPSALLPPAERLAGAGGSREALDPAVERIEIVVGIIRSEGERHLVLEHRMPRIGAREPARPQSRLGHRPIRQRMDRLHRGDDAALRSEEHTSELQSIKRISYAVFCLKKKKTS